MSKDFMISLVFLFIGLLLCTLAVSMLRKTLRRMQSWETVFTTGKIVDHQARRASKGGVTYNNIVEYEDSGKIFRVASKSGSAWKGRLGKEVRVLYHRDHTEDAVIVSFSETWLPIIVLSIMGAISFGVGGYNTLLECCNINLLEILRR
jgi:hypothetical protein